LRAKRSDRPRPSNGRHDLDRHLLPELVVGARGEIYTPHAATPDLADHAVRADALPDDVAGRVGAGVDRQVIEKGTRLRVGLDQAHHFGGEGGVIAAGALDVRASRGRRAGKGLFEERAHARLSLDRHGGTAPGLVRALYF
jgi:hypothetical protein